MQEDTITLNPSDVIAEGGERMVFAHPDHPFRLIKVVKPRHTEEFNRWTFGHLTQRYIPSARWRPTVKQYDEYRRLMLGRLFDVNFNLPISHLYGFVKTNLGVGCITERVTDADGNNAPTLQKLVRSGRFTDDDLQRLNRFVEELYDVSVCVGDVGPANFVYGHRHIGPSNARSEPSWVLVDGFGDRFAITIRSVSRRVRTMGLDDCFKRSKKVAGLEWVPAQRRYRITARKPARRGVNSSHESLDALNVSP